MDAAGLNRRLGIAVRLVLYPMAIGLIVIAWRHYHGDPPVAHPLRWSGVTSQGQAIRAATSRTYIRGARHILDNAARHGAV